jgi:hypothetical protein
MASQGARGDKLSPEKEYQRRNPGAGGAPAQQQERARAHPRVTRDTGGAGKPSNVNEQLKGRRRRGVRGATT